ncbi:MULTISPECIES: hypothetical protein [Paenibacillus]|uniref:hypothetical protein n=1 Tax=Paenibacillus TaxID=44249 RepID=UPI0015C2DBCB|nr:hypothetical protein [Paenibacillus odorifer]
MGQLGGRGAKGGTGSDGAIGDTGVTKVSVTVDGVITNHRYMIPTLIVNKIG